MDPKESPAPPGSKSKVHADGEAWPSCGREGEDTLAEPEMGSGTADPSVRSDFLKFVITKPDDNAHAPPNGPAYPPKLTVSAGEGSAPPTLVTEQSDVCNDLGENDSIVQCQRRRPSAQSTESWVAGASGGFPPILPDNAYAPLGGPAYPPRLTLSTGEGSAPQSGATTPRGTKLSLEKRLRAAMLRTRPGGGSAEAEAEAFLPRGELCRLVTGPAVQQALLEADEKMKEEEAGELAGQICEPATVVIGKKKDGGVVTKQSSRRKLFAALLISQKALAIRGFIIAEIYDTNLPLLKEHVDGQPVLRRKDRRRYLECCKDWEAHEADLFYMNQWIFLSPFFEDPEMSADENQRKRVMHYPLDRGIVPPLFLRGQKDGEVNGGFSTVFKVYVHKDHHGFGPVEEREKLHLAVKKLLRPEKDAFEREVQALKMFSHLGDPHMIKLLWTYHWRDNYYLVFPWADGNLWEFMERYPNGPELTDARPRGVWMEWFAEQCHGIVSALSKIHVVSAPSLEVGASGTDGAGAPSSLYAGLWFGRHGDLKPENILWFIPRPGADGDDGSGIGVLKVSDFGLIDFHGRGSRSGLNAARFNWSATYHGPECMIPQKLSQSYDIWTLGCVYIEFVSWFLLGHELTRHKFSERRLDEDDYNPIREDTFFKICTSADGQVGAVVKQSVLDWVKSLRDHEGCSAFLDDLLDFIISKMLVVETDEGQKRAKCNEVEKRLGAMLVLCHTDADYRLKPSSSPAPPRTSAEPTVFARAHQTEVLWTLEKKRRSMTHPPERLSEPHHHIVQRSRSEPAAMRPMMGRPSNDSLSIANSTREQSLPPARGEKTRSPTNTIMEGREPDPEPLGIAGPSSPQLPPKTPRAHPVPRSPPPLGSVSESGSNLGRTDENHDTTQGNTAKGAKPKPKPKPGATPAGPAPNNLTAGAEDRGPRREAPPPKDEGGLISGLKACCCGCFG